MMAFSHVLFGTFGGHLNSIELRHFYECLSDMFQLFPIDSIHILYICYKISQCFVIFVCLYFYKTFLTDRDMI